MQRPLAVAALSCLTLAAANAQDAAAPSLPLEPGLTVVTAISDTRGDFETVKQIVEANDAAVTIAFAADLPGGGAITALRPVRREDLREATEYRNFFVGEEQAVHPGTTSLGPSVAVVRALRETGESPFKCYIRKGRTYRSTTGTLRLLGDDTVTVLVNGARTELPVLHAEADLEEADGELWILDHPEQPLALRYRLQRRLPPEYAKLPPQLLEQVQLEPDVLEVVKIESPFGGGEQPLEESLEQALEEEGRVEVYGIYFDFDSATLKPESDPVLTRIAAVLERNPAWHLSIEGHTDSVGEEAYNQDLSERRAAAVEQALVERWEIAPDRLTTAGFGESRPKASNETLAGRAENRRVELVRGPR